MTRYYYTDKIYKSIIKYNSFQSGLEKGLDTLTLFIRILDVVVQGAKAVGLLVVLFLVFFTVRSLPNRLNNILSNIATACLLFIIVASYVQHVYITTFGYTRIITMLFSLTSGVSLFLVLVTALSYFDSFNRGVIISKIAVLAQYNQGFKKCIRRDDAGYISSSYLETTPILLA